MLAALSRWILIAAIGQVPPEVAPRKAAPADVDVAVRIRGVEATRADPPAMLEAMSPDWADLAEGAPAGPLTEFRERHGAHASKPPFVTLIRLGEAGGEGGPPPLAVPKEFLDAILSMFRAMSEGEAKIYTDSKVDPAARIYRGLTFTHASAAMGPGKLAELVGNGPAQQESMKAMLGDGRLIGWYGTDGKRLLQVMAPSWEDARPRIDAYLDGNRGIGRSARFKAARGELPERAGLLLLYSSQELVRMMARQLGAVTKNADLEPPADRPAEPAYLGASPTPHASEGYEVHLVIPSPVGTVVAKGRLPIWQGRAPRGADP